MADLIASYLRGPGDALREAVMAIPLSVAKGIFIVYFILLILWVLSMKKSEVEGPLHGVRKSINLRPYAVAALLGEIVIYAIF